MAKSWSQIVLPLEKRKQSEMETMLQTMFPHLSAEEIHQKTKTKFSVNVVGGTSFETTWEELAKAVPPPPPKFVCEECTHLFAVMCRICRVKPMQEATCSDKYCEDCYWAHGSLFISTECYPLEVFRKVPRYLCEECRYIVK